MFKVRVRGCIMICLVSLIWVHTETHAGLFPICSWLTDWIYSCYEDPLMESPVPEVMEQLHDISGTSRSIWTTFYTHTISTCRHAVTLIHELYLRMCMYACVDIFKTMNVWLSLSLSLCYLRTGVTLIDKTYWSHYMAWFIENLHSSDFRRCPSFCSWIQQHGPQGRVTKETTYKRGFVSRTDEQWC